MNLAQWLSAGRALKGTRKAPLRYKVLKGNPIPSFGAVSQVEEPDSPRVSEVGVEVVSTNRTVKGEPSALEEQAIRGVSVGAREDPDRGGLMTRVWSRHKSRPVRRWVQGEFQLDRVRVIRNDLNDSDLALVPAPPPAPPQMEANSDNGRSGSIRAGEGMKSIPTEAAWARLLAVDDFQPSWFQSNEGEFMLEESWPREWVGCQSDNSGTQ